MIEKVTAANVGKIANPAFREYAQRYVDIEEGFREAVETFGVPFAVASGEDDSESEGGNEGEGVERESNQVNDRAAEPPAECEANQTSDRTADQPTDRAAFISCLADRGLRVLNDGKSLVVGWQSSACEACRLGLQTETFVMTLACPRRCFFCFNPNQVDFDGRIAGPRDVVAQLEARAAAGAKLCHVALTGGEPLLFPRETVAFFQRARELFSGVHTRLYTSGSGLDEVLLEKLRDAGLLEIRFSIKTDEGTEDMKRTLDLIASAVGVVPDVMVEMPVMPGEVDLMKDLLVRLETLGVRGINLLELGFPLFNGEEFARRGYRLKAEPYRVLYDYAYAAGLPVAGSEEACLELLKFAQDEGLSLGVHYCSMENKHTGQVFQQNAPHAKDFSLHSMSKRDHFLKSGKAFGPDRATVREVLFQENVPFEESDDFNYVEFPVTAVSLLRDKLPDFELAISYAICEDRDGETVLRELRIDRTTPAAFDFERDW